MLLGVQGVEKRQQRVGAVGWWASGASLESEGVALVADEQVEVSEVDAGRAAFDAAQGVHRGGLVRLGVVGFQRGDGGLQTLGGVGVVAHVALEHAHLVGDFACDEASRER